MEEKKLIGEQNGNVNNNQDNVNASDEKDYRMKFFKWSPDWLQRFNTINWFLFVLSLASVTQGIIVNGLSVVSLPTIEKEFGLSSKSAGLIVAGNDASALLLVGIVSFFGAKAHKPRWMAIGVLVTGLGSLLFAVPKLMVDTYRPLKPSQMALDICSTNKAMKVMDCTQSGSTLYVAVLFLAQFIMGAGITPLFTLGPAFLDENVSPKASPIYLGIWFASTMLGPGLGFLIGGQYLQIFTNIEQPANITPKDPQWIGAWWLGFVTLSILFFLCGFLMLLFPKVIPSCQEKRRKAIANGAIPKADPTIEFTIKGYILSSIKICCNKIFMCAVFAMTVKTLYIIGLASFLVKILVVKFGLSPYKVSTMLGVMMVPSMFIGIIGGAFIMRKFNVKVASKSAAKLCLIVTIVQLPAAFIYLLPGCNNTNLAGKMVPYQNQTEIGESLYSQCNSKCMCTNKIYMPVCGSDDISYQSPCFAGCSVILLGKDGVPFFGNCTCLPPMKSGDKMKMSKRKTNIQLPKDLIKLFSKRGNTTVNPMVMQMQMNYMASTLYNQVSLGSCDRDCKNFIVFVLVVMASIIFSFLAGTPHKILILRSVPDNQRSFALGIQFLIMRSLSFLPGPIIMGAVVDSQCITWMYDKCGAKTNCADYDIGNLSRNLTLFALISSGGAAIFYGLAVFLFPRSTDDEDADSKPMSALIAEQEAETTNA